ncbi:hypothetical protein [Rhodovastum atsumiense]|nr:hypothetical protein [Rhodovastum atsumiense]
MPDEPPPDAPDADEKVLILAYLDLCRRIGLRPLPWWRESRHPADDMES